MHRTFAITLPADTNPHNLYSLIVGTAAYGLVNGGTNETGITGAIPTDGILPDRVQQLIIQVNTGSIKIKDRNTSDAGQQYDTPGSLTETSNRNSICLKDYIIKGVAGSETLSVDMSST